MTASERFDSRDPDSAGLTEAWRQAHFGAQAVAELGKSWARESDDDRHSSMSWYSSHNWRGLVGQKSDHGFQARLRLCDLVLSVVKDEGKRVAEIGLEGMTVDEAVAWMGEQGERHIGPRLQPARPAPDLPEHPLARGGRFKRVAQLDMITDLYEGTDMWLASTYPQFSYPRCWPHHFDLAALRIVERDDMGAATKTIGIGVTPPDSIDQAGYWYGSAWMKEAPRDVVLPPLILGRWHSRKNAPALAVRPVTEPIRQCMDFFNEAVKALAPVVGDEELIARL
jgi:hypothetical protein